MCSDFASKVPSFDYPTSLEEQWAALETNPLLDRMKKARQEYDDHHRPQYHYVNPEGILNDPNGLCYWQGRWHLFYQGYPPDDPRQHWGHAISDDLIHWQDLPYAIYPDPEDCCFSGATLVEDDRVIAMYHGTKVGNMIAVSSDPLLLNWDKLSNAPVIPLPSADERKPYNVFDPCIWKVGDTYYALSAGTRKEGPAGKQIAADFLFKSKNLESWEYLHQFIEDDHYTRVGDDGACPYFWPIGNKYMLCFFSHTSGGQCLVGRYDLTTQKFHVEHGEKFNFGPSGPAGVHAPSVTPHPSGDGSLIVIFNMNPGKSTHGWDQIMTLPRQMSLSEETGEVNSTPVDTVETLRGNVVQLDRFIVQANSRKSFTEFQSDSFEWVIDLDVAGTQVVELDVLCAPDDSEYTRISIFDERGYWDRNRPTNPKGKYRHRGTFVTLDTSHSSIAGDVRCRSPERVQVSTSDDHRISLRVFVDRSVVEVFINDEKCVAARVYPDQRSSNGIAIGARGGHVSVARCQFFEMNSIYEH